MPPEAQPGRPLAGDSPPPRRTLDEKLAAARSSQAKKRRRAFTVAGVALAVVGVAVGVGYLVSEFELVRATEDRGREAGDAVVEESPPAAQQTTAVESAPTVTETVAEVDATAQTAAEVATAVEEEPPVVETVTEVAPVVETVTEVVPVVEEEPPVVETVTEVAPVVEEEPPVVEIVTEVAPVVEEEPPVVETVTEVAPAVEEEPPVVETVTEVVPVVEEDPPVVEIVTEVAPVAEAPSELGKWLALAEVARVENRPQKEIAALRKVLELDSADADARQRLQELQVAMTRARFAVGVERAQDALDAGDLPAAAQHIQAAAAVSPGHEALQPLQEQLQVARAEREFAARIALGAQAGRQDDWQTAVAHFSRARAIKPNDSGAVAGLSRAQEVVDAARKIDGYLAQPQRLADDGVVKAAAAYLAEVEAVAARSPKLRAQRDKLSAAVAAYLAEVEVVVVSDNASDIIVRGVGRVGKTERRAIKLRPGRREFECKRRGYQSKIVPLDIPPGAAGPFEVAIVCDEKI